MPNHTEDWETESTLVMVYNRGGTLSSSLLLYERRDDVDRNAYELDDEDDSVGGEVFFSGAIASNNPFAATADVDVEEHLTTPAAEFNPFATITEDDQEVFDPFQTIHDDDALNVPFSSEDRDTEDDAMSPSRFKVFFIIDIIVIVVVMRKS